DSLKPKYKQAIDVPPERMFIGFDAYRKAIDCLRAGDVAIMTTPPAFRWVHFQYAIDKAVNVFMEKPVTVVGPTTLKMFDLADQAMNRNLKVGVGLMSRHCAGRRELFDRIGMGQIGDIIMMRAYRIHGPAAECFVPRNSGKLSDVLYQVQKFHAFLWAS